MKRQIKVTNLETNQSEVKDFWQVHADIVKNYPAYQLRIQTEKELTIGNTKYEQVRG